MNNKHTIRSVFATLFTLLFIISFVLTGCTSASETASGDTGTGQAAGTAAYGQLTVTEAAQEGISYVSIDINPSIELTVKYGAVLDAAAYNDDGTEILLATDVKGMAPNEATAALIAEFAAAGYITPDSTDAAIVITVYGDDEDNLLTNLQTAATESLTGLGITCDIVASAVEPEVAQIAREAGITPGRFLLIQYLAERDDISLEEARDIYGDMKMKDLLDMIPDRGDVFGDDAYFYLASLMQGLTAEQLQALTSAQQAFEAAMKAAVEAFNQAKEEARGYFKAARDAAREAFKETRDRQAWRQARAAAKQEMEQRYEAARTAFNAAKAQAREAFMAAVVGLGLTDEQIEAMLEWDFDFEWEFEDDWEEDQDIDAGDEDDDGEDDGGEDDDGEDDDGEDDDDEDDDEGEGGNGGNHGHHGNQNG